ncbi:MAG: hypothetical protein RBS78_00895 [Coriobacteriia bacterium]|jgi:hypothetical protein|nr:hypothetical protein [Coriobacteriia bacterium]
MGRRLLVDADVLVYESAFSAQKTVYEYQGREFPDAKQAEAYCKENNLDYRALRKDGQITSRVEALPESVARNCFNMKLNNILEVAGSTDYLLLLSGDGNFRDEAAVTKGYKANRASVPKPEHYLFCRALILNNKHSEITVGVEADDAMGMYMADDPSSVICSIDKDLMQIPGRHYNWGKGIKFKVPPADGLYWFHRQLLTGDATDNIPGIPGLGEKKAEALLEGTRNDPQAGFKVVLEEYNKGPFKFRDGSITKGTPTEYLNEQGILLWMMRRPKERWNIDYYVTEYLNG